MPGKRNLDTPTKERIVQARKNGLKEETIKNLFGVSRWTVNRLCERQRFTGNVHRKQKSGRHRKTTPREDRALRRFFNSSPNLTATDGMGYLKRSFGVEMTTRSVRNRLNSLGLFARRPARKPLMILRHRKLRLDFAQRYQHWTVDDWKRVLWSDEVKFNLFNSDGNFYIRRPKGTRYCPKYTHSTVKFNGGGIMCWGCFSSASMGPLVLIEGIMNASKYREIMQKSMLPFANANMSPDWLYQQDRDPKHTSELMLGQKLKIRRGVFVRMPGWFRLNNVDLLRTPPYSPDCNPIEHLWAHVKRELKGYRFSTKMELWDRVQEIWSSISQSKASRLVASMPRRLQEIIKAKGGPTRY